MPGVWGPYLSAMVPGLWLNEGGQSATGRLVRTHPPFLKHCVCLFHAINQHKKYYIKCVAKVFTHKSHIHFFPPSKQEQLCIKYNPPKLILNSLF